MTKRNYLQLVFALLFSNLMAKTITVSNNVNSPGQFTNIQTAINDANTLAGDVIIIQGSPTNYNDITINKSIKLYGAGIKPLTPSGTRSYIQNITVTANNVTLSGINAGTLNINAGVTGTRIEFNAFNNGINCIGTNILLQNNRAVFIRLFSTATNILVLNNIIETVRGENTTYTNIIIKNNIFRRGNDNNPYINYQSYSEHFSGFGTSTSLQIWDNIFYGSTLGTIGQSTFSNNIFTNITTASVSANGNTNVNNTFGVTQPNGNNFDGTQADPLNYDLGATGLAVAASDGTQIGVNGGGVTFKMRGESPMPYIRNVFNVTPIIVPSGGTLNVTVTATNGNQ